MSWNSVKFFAIVCPRHFIYSVFDVKSVHFILVQSGTSIDFRPLSY